MNLKTTGGFFLICFLLALFEPQLSSKTAPLSKVYHGFVVDSETKHPVMGARVSAISSSTGIFQVPRETQLYTTKSRRDGSFDLIIPQSSGKVSYIQVTVDAPMTSTGPKKGDISSYGGILFSISTSHDNTILVKKTYFE